MAVENFINQVFVESINVIASNEWRWPDAWDNERKIKFLSDALIYGENNELYEQCNIIKHVKSQIEK